MHPYVGTSGFSYKEWLGSFYPEGTRPPEMLGLYAERLPSVEINNTFYRMPSEKVLDAWAAAVPDGFSFALKASRRITHQKRLADAGSELDYLVGKLGALGDALGPVLFQLPPYLRKDLPRLESFLELLPEGLRAAFEFRHPSWFDDEIFAALRDRRAALVVADTGDPERDPPLEPTAPWGYLRLRQPGYSDAELDRWATRIREQPWEAAWVFFKHEDEGAGPRIAEAFQRRLAAA